MRAPPLKINTASSSIRNPPSEYGYRRRPLRLGNTCIRFPVNRHSNGKLCLVLKTGNIFNRLISAVFLCIPTHHLHVHVCISLGFVIVYRVPQLRTCACKVMCWYNMYTCIYLPAYTCTCMNVHIDLNSYIHIYYACMHTYMYMYIHTYIHTYMYIHCTCTHTHRSLYSTCTYDLHAHAHEKCNSLISPLSVCLSVSLPLCLCVHVCVVIYIQCIRTHNINTVYA